MITIGKMEEVLNVDLSVATETFANPDQPCPDSCLSRSRFHFVDRKAIFAAQRFCRLAAGQATEKRLMTLAWRGERRGINLNLVPLEPDVKAGDLSGRGDDQGAGANVEPPLMPRAGNDTVLNVARPERPAFMRTAIVDGINFTLHPKERNLLAFHLDNLSLIGRDRVDTRHGDPFFQTASMKIGIQSKYNSPCPLFR